MENNKKIKEKLIEVLNKNPIIQPACDRCGISRATFYRWRSGDQKFAEKVEKAITEGRTLVTELAESKLMNAIKSENLGAIKYWLQYNDKRYSNRLEIKGEITTTSKTLTPKQEESIKKALLLVDFKPNKEEKK
jgi:hypothetical protein